MTKLIELKGISKSYDGEKVIDSMNLYIRDGEFITLLGPSGCGKTTTLRIIGGFEWADEGELYFDGAEISDVPAYKRNINTVFQKYALFPHLNVYENIAFPLRLKKLKEDENLSKYYGVSYKTWKDTVIETYKYINTAIGGLQEYQIVDHKILVAERILDASEDAENFKAQQKRFFAAAKSAIDAEIAVKLTAMDDAGKLGYGLKVEIDREALIDIFMAASQRNENDARYAEFIEDFDAFCDAIEENYSGKAVGCTASGEKKHLDENDPCGCEGKYETLAIDTCEIDFSDYVTSSEASNKAEYQKTHYTIDNGNVVMVTYKKGTETVNFILNYNSYDITVRMNGELVVVKSYAYKIY